MKTEIDIFARRFEVFGRDVLGPAVYPASSLVSVSAFQTADPVPFNEAALASYTPVEPGFEWGPAWSTCWFKINAEVPESFAGERVMLRFDTGAEAMLYTNGEPRRGFDVNRDAAELFASAKGGESIEVFVEAACNHPFGIVTFEWDHAEVERRWKSPTPARLDRCELAVRDDDAWRLHASFEIARKLMAELEPGSARAGELYRALRRVTEVVGDRPDAERIAEAVEIIDAVLATPAGGSSPICHAVGHAHIDTAWLWPIRETRRKVQRSWANVLELLDTHAEFTFIGSQAQQYAWLEDDAPALFDRLREHVNAGRFEPYGGMWIEPDANCPSGESLCQQFIHGIRYWNDRFPDHPPQHTLYLPDTFGFPASLPQIARLAGVDTFITNKMSWSQMTSLPLTNFRWRGIDGSEMLAHMTPGGDYNATLSPKELRKGVDKLAGTQRHGHEGPDEYLQPFGLGDGGGGPTETMLLAVDLANNCEGLPRVRHTTGAEFRDRLHDLDKRTGGLPVWDGELYLELHRGTLTSQAWLKAANRRAERGLRLVELLTAGEQDQMIADETRAEIDRLWKLVLLNQFHDILPGSSIPWVYDDAREQYDDIERSLGELTERALARLGDANGFDQGAGVLNPASADRSGVVETGVGLEFVADIPAVGIAPLASATPSAPVTIEGGRLSNGAISAEIDPAGRVRSLVCERTGVDLVGETPLNRLALYEDRPMNWDAWDVDEFAYDRLVWENDSPPDAWNVVTADPLRAEIAVERSLGESSRVRQVFRLDAESPRLDIITTIDWRERHRVLRAEFEPSIRSRHATYDIQFGTIERPTHTNTPADRAMFEVCAHRWMDLSQPGAGLAILNDSKYAHACRGSNASVTLLRAPTHPDPECDQGEHTFAYALMPHAGDWRAAGVDREAEAMNDPLRVIPHAPNDAWRAVSVRSTGGAGVEIAAIRDSQFGHGTKVIRLVETRGGAGEVTIDLGPVYRHAERVDLLERPIDEPCLHSGATIAVPIKPYEIVTLAAK